MSLLSIFRAFIKLLVLFVLVIAFVLVLPGCSSTTFNDGTASFSRTSLGTQTSISKLVVSRDGNATTIELESESDQVQAIEKAVGAAVKAAKP